MIATRRAIATLAALVAVLCSAASASAGPLVQRIYITSGSGCSLLGVYGSFGLLSAGPCGGGTLSLQFQPPPIPMGAGFPVPIFSSSDTVPVRRGTTVGYVTNAPAGITINSASISQGQTYGISDGQGWSAYSFRAGRMVPLHSFQVATDAAATADSSFSSSYFGVAMKCDWAQCTNRAQINLNNIAITASEAEQPTITPAGGAGNLWNQTGRWIWNAPGDGWPLELSAQDVAGVCSLTAQAGVTALADSLPAPNGSSWQECAEPTWTAPVDTRDSVPAAGDLPVAVDATNAGQVTSQMTETLQVDNDPVSVSLSTPNDPNPTVWVNHAVTVDATASAGPSGLGGMNCGVDGRPAQSYPAGGVVVNGDGVSTVSCTAWNNAVDPNGDHVAGTSSMTVHVDEAPPVVTLEPVNPNDPTGLVVDTSDSESGVAGGSIEMAPVGTGSWTSLPTTFTGSQLLAHFNDGGASGPYAFRVRSCDNVGNCASTTRALVLPVRAAAVSEVSIEKVPRARCASPSMKHHATASSARRGHQRVSHAKLVRASGLSLVGAAGGPLRARVRAPVPAGKDLATASSAGVSVVRSRLGGAPPGAAVSWLRARAPASVDAGRDLVTAASTGVSVVRSRLGGAPPGAAVRSLRARVPVSVDAGKDLVTASSAGVLVVRPRLAGGSRGVAAASAAGQVAQGRGCGGDSARLASRAMVGYGRAVTVHGLLMSGGGLPLAGQPVAVLTAPDNGSDAFSEAAAVTTGPDGRWAATLAPGPSRIIEASYAGSPTVLPATGYATVITPAKIVLMSVVPDRIPWGSRVRITGRVLGGYIPASSKLLRLDLGIVGIPGLSKIQGIPNVAADGTFTTAYKFGRYQGVVRFWLQVSSLAEADFPFSPSHSRRWIVTVGVSAPSSSSRPRRLVSRPHHHKHKHKHRARADHRGERR
jgi:hypothetical protein